MSSPKYTEQQAAAILTRGTSIGLSAGAGCGKTFVLTQRFLQQLEPGEQKSELGSLVAITFTDRAAREMRDRVREACQQRLNNCPTEDVEHWLGVLRGLDNARISTIHAFCTSLLKTNAIEAKLDPGFHILEVPLADALLEEAAELVVHRRLISEDETASIMVLRFGLEKTRELMVTLARQRFRVTWDALGEATGDRLANIWRQDWQTKFIPRLLNEFRQSPDVVQLQKLMSEESPSHPEMQQRWSTLAQWLDPSCLWTEPVAALNELSNAARVQGGGGAKAWSSDSVYRQVQSLFTDLRASIKKLTGLLEYNEEHLERSAEYAAHAWKLAHEVSAVYEDLKQQSGSLDFDDLLMRARNLLRDSPDVRERVARGISLLMVDEFQDTDPVQADIVRALCGLQIQQGKLFLVGDIKQSIYRFRRADPQVFREMRGALPPQGQMSLTRNFRSQPAILNFVNLLFQDEFADYEPLEPFQNRQLSPEPSIEFLFADSDAEATASEAEASSGKVSAQELRQREADWMARRISEMLRDEMPRVRCRHPETGDITLRRIVPGDITILFRALTNVQEYETALRTYGLDYYLVGGKAFFAQQEVFDLLNLCLCLNNPDDEVALIGVLRSPFFGLSDDTLQAMRPRTGDWWQQLAEAPHPSLPMLQQDRWKHAGRLLYELHIAKDHSTIAALLTTAIERTGYDAALLAEFLGNRKIANLRKLIDQAEVFDRSERFTLQDFIHRLQTSVLEQTDEEFATTLPESGDVIRMMTVHQSKGLEFPVVFVADINRVQRGSHPGAYLHPDWGALVKLPTQFGQSFEHLALEMLKIEEAAAEKEETQRLFYVAVTRAADHLVLSAGVDHGSQYFSPWMMLLSQRFDLGTGAPRKDPLLGSAIGASSRDQIPRILIHRQPPQAVTRPVKRRISLSSFWDRLWTAEPQPLPETLTPIPADPSAARTWSVSVLEEVDAELNPRAARAGLVERTIEHSPDQATILGTLVHTAIENFDFLQPENWESTLDQALRMQAKRPDESVVEAAAEILQRLARSALISQFASARQLMREVSFAMPLGASEGSNSEPVDLVIGQIDLCMRSANGDWSIFDFKTVADRPDTDDEAHLAPYRFQLGVYALAVEEWFGRSVANVGLILLRPDVRIVPLTWNDRVRDDIRGRLASAVQAARKLPLPIEQDHHV